MLVAGCGHAPPSAKSLTRYRARDIDKPYTLPADMNTWVTVAAGGYVGPLETEPDPTPDPDDPEPSANEGQWVAPVPLPVGYEISLGSRVTLEGFGPPLGLRAQISKSDRQLWGVRTGPTVMRFTSVEGFVMGMATTVFHRYRLRPNWALVSRTGVTYVYRENESDSVVGSVSTGPLHQLSDDLSVRPFGAINTIERDGQMSASLSFGGEAGYNFNRRWRAELLYRGHLDELGFARTSHVAATSVVYFW